MNSSSIQSSDSASQDRIDFQRFQGIWNNIKKVKQSSGHSQTDKQTSNPTRKSIASVKKAIEQEEQINIETRLVLTQKQLAKSKENTNLLLKKLSQAQEQIQYLQYELEKQSKDKQQLIQQYQALKSTITKLQKQKKNELQKSTLRGIHTEQQNQKLQQSLNQKQRQLDKLQLKLRSLQMTNKNLQSQISLLKQNAKIMQKRVEENQRSWMGNEQSGMSYSNNRGAQILELQEAYGVIERLGILLKNTQEYKAFGIPLEDMKNYHFLKNIQKRIKKNELLDNNTNKSPQNASRLCQCMQVKIDQKLLWSPILCYKKALQLKLKYNSNLTQQCIQQLLFQMNKIYQSKQQTTLRTFKEAYQKKLQSVRRKSQPAKYDEIVARKQIERLKKQVLTERYSKGKGGKGSNSELGDNLEILKTIGQYEDQLKLKQRQILLLKQRIRLMQNQNANYDKILYLQGSLWVLDKVLTQIQLNTQDLQDFQTKFRQRIQVIDQQEWMGHFKYFFENITQNQNLLMEKILQMKESTLKKMGARREKEERQRNGLSNQQQHEASFGY